MRYFSTKRRLQGQVSPLLIAAALGLASSFLMASVALLSESLDTVSAQQQGTGQDLTLHSDNGSPRGIWSDGSTMWVADFSDRKLYAYSLSDSSRLEDKDIALGSSNFKALGIWSDGTTIWALNTGDDKIYGFSLADGTRDSNRDITLDTENDTPEGIWSDGTTIYVVNQNDMKLYAYSLSDGSRQSDSDVSIPIDRPRPIGVWSDTSTFWISYDHHQDYSNEDDYRIYAFNLEDGAREEDLDVVISTDPNNRVSGIWSDGTTMWVTDRFHRKIFAYELPQPTLSSDATLSGLRLSTGPLTPNFTATTTTYTSTVSYDVTEVTVHTTSTDSAASVELVDDEDSELPDADPVEDGHQVKLAVNENVIVVKVTAEDEANVQTYSVTVTRGKPDVSISSLSRDVVEGGSAELIVIRDTAVAERLEVTLSVSETGALLLPSEEGNSSITIASDATSTAFFIAADSNDDGWEDHSIVTVAIVEDETYRIVGTASSTSFRILDDDFPEAVAVLSVFPSPFAEGATTTATITVTTQADRQPHGSGGVLRLNPTYGTAEADDLTILSQNSFDVSASDFSTTTVGSDTRFRAQYTATLTSVEDSIVEIGETFGIELSKATSSSASLTLGQPSTITVGIVDDDAALRSLTLSGIALSPEFASHILEYEGQADYSLEETTVTASAGHTDSKEPTILLGGIVDLDGIIPLEVGENEITVRVVAEDATSTAAYVVNVTRAKPKISISAVEAEVEEGQDVEFLVSRDAAASEPLDVQIGIAESGSLVEAASLGSRTVTIPGSTTTATTTVLTHSDDSLWEPHSLVTATVKSTERIEIQPGQGEASTLVRDNDFPDATADLVVAPNPASEGATVSATITVTTNSEEEPHGGGGTLTLSAREGTAQAADYGRFGRTSFLVEPDDFDLVDVSGMQRYQASYTAAVAITDDSDSESDESFHIVVTKTDAPRIELPTPATTTIVIAANDSSTDPTLSQLTVDPGTLSPVFSSTTTLYRVDLGYGVERVTVWPTVNSDNSDVDFLDGSNNDLPDVSTSDDGHQINLEVGENTVRIKVTAEDNVTIQTYTIVLVRQNAEVSILPKDTEVPEGTNLGFTVVRNGQVSEGLDVRVEVSETEAMVADIEEGSRTVTIPSNATSTSIAVSSEHDDQIWEAHSTVRVMISASSSYSSKQGVALAETTVKDDDFPEATATLSVSPTEVNEGAVSSLSITVTTTHDQDPHGPGGTLTLTPVGGTATARDYGSLSQSTFPIAAADFVRLDIGSGSMAYRALYAATVETVDDSESEPDETIVFQLDKDANSPNITIVGPATTTLTILANDASSDASLGSLNMSDGTLSPPFAATTTNYTATVPYGTEQVTLEHSKGDIGSEVTILDAEGSLLEDANVAPGFQVDVAVGSTIVKLRVTAEDGNAMQTYVVTITRSKPTVGILEVASNVPEGGVIEFTVSRDAPVTEALDVIVNVFETDMLLAASEAGDNAITIPSLSTSTLFTIAADTDDDVWEEHSTVTASIVASSTYEVAAGRERAHVQLEDDDFPEATAEFEVLPDPVTEGEQLTARVTVTTKLDQQPHGDGGTLLLSLTGETAQTDDVELPHEMEFDIAANDFVPIVVSGASRYRASYTATTTIADDDDAEPSETFRVTISKRNADRIQLPAPSTTTVTIAPSDLSTDAALSLLTVSEGMLSPPFSSSTNDYTVGVAYSVQSLVITPMASDSSASTNVDSTPVFSGQGHIVDLTVGTTTIDVVVTAQDSVTTRTYSVVIVRSRPVVGISPVSTEITEGSIMGFTVSRSVAVSESLEVQVDVAESGDLVPDEAEVSKSVTIPPGATSTILTVPTDPDDDTWEEHSRVTASLPTSGDYLVRPNGDAAHVSVRDDDFPSATASLSVSPNPVAEGETFTLTVTVRTIANEQPHRGGGTLMLEAGGGTASPNDYGTLSRATYSIGEADFVLDSSSNVYVAEYLATIEITADAEVETGESFDVSLSLSSDSPESLTLGHPDSETVNIRDFSIGLVELSLSGVTLTPQFSSDKLNYTGSVPYAIVQTVVSATTTEASSRTPRIYLKGLPVTNGKIPLSIGENPITIEVMSKDSSDTRTYRISVNREKPEVSIAASVSQASEGDVLGYTVSRSTSAPDTLDVLVEVAEDGEMVPAGSLGEGSRSVIIPAGASSTSFAVETEEDDQVWDDHSTATVSITTSELYVIKAGEAVAETLILDDDFPESTASMSVVPSSVVEGGAVTVRVDVTTIRNEAPHTDSGPLMVRTSNDTAIGGVDYVSLSPSDGELSFLQTDFAALSISGQTRYQASEVIDIETLLDEDQEGVEKFVITLDRVTEGPATTSNQIVLDAASKMLAVTIQDSPESELASLALSEGTLIPPFGTSTRTYAAEVSYAVEQLTVSATTSRANTKATFYDSNDAPIADLDSTTEGHQVPLSVGENTIEIKVSEASNTVLDRYTVTVTRVQPVLSITSAATTSVEGDPAVFTVHRDFATSDSLLVGLLVTETGDMVVSGPQGEGPRSVTIPGYATSTNLTVTTDPNDEWQEHSIVSASINSEGSYAISANSGRAEIQVTDDDFPAATATLAVAPNPVDEGRQVFAAVTITTGLDQMPHRAAGAIQLVLVGLSATSGEDFALPPDDRLAFAASEFAPVNIGGQTRYSAKKQIAVSTVDDSEYEGTETFTIEIVPVTVGPGRTADQIAFHPSESLREVSISDNDDHMDGGGGNSDDPPGSGDSQTSTIGGSSSRGGGGSSRSTSNRKPKFEEGGETSRTIEENSAIGTRIGPRVRATDRDGDKLTYSLRGEDRSSFTINESTGRLHTATLLNHETDSRYYLSVEVTDGKGGTDSIEVTIVVTNVDEAPAVTGAKEITHLEQTAGVLATYEANDPEMGDIFWNLSGEDAGEFYIDVGALAFRSPPDFENPSDSNADNLYEVTVSASDGLHTSILDVIVTVADLDESPSPTPTPLPTQRPASTPLPTPSPTVVLSATPTASATSMPSPVPTHTATPSPTITPTATPVATVQPTPIPTATATPVPMPTMTRTPMVLLLSEKASTPTPLTSPRATSIPVASFTHREGTAATPVLNSSQTPPVALPTSSATPAARSVFTDGGVVPAWLMLSITFWAIMATGAGVYVYLRHR